ncbi:hypothetical protein LTR84_001204 [Exophiala bonariae]|uniref:UBZ4-type domain-containing protein n=1 Tax=Exophiala bonariae TaxID=1690606 RepID=A0AAV9NT47_9EURO|nr:hypothetical protein LTR84_001204 [Exophiala bonariae]
MADTPQSSTSPESGEEPTGTTGGNQSASKLPASKDKECPYCHQQFTSSSLGRHLDQFISKKKPDGIHNVDEIRRMRGGITRRTARGGKRDSAPGDRDDTRSPRHSPPPPSEPAVSTVSTDNLNRVPPGGIQSRINRLNWLSTGVINDPTSLDSPMPNAPPTPALVHSPSIGTKRTFTMYSQDLTTAETNRALELSLREVLDSLRAATKHATPKPSPFKFDVQSQTYPGLCLKVLSPPATLFQTSPFSTPTSIPISPPGPDQLAPLRQKLTSTIDYWKWQALRLAQPTTSNIAEEADFLTQSATQWTESTMAHLEASFQNWMAHPIEIRNLLWQVELLRAYSTEQQKATELEERIESLKQEATQLQQQVEYLSRCQWPREMALWPPKRKPFGHKMREEIRLINLNKLPAPDGVEDMVEIPDNIHTRGDKWDFDKLVSKWKSYIKEDKNRRIPPVQSSATPTEGPSIKIADYHKSYVESPVNGVSMNGPSPNGMEERRRSTRNQKGNISIVSDY